MPNLTPTRSIVFGLACERAQNNKATRRNSRKGDGGGGGGREWATLLFVPQEYVEIKNVEKKIVEKKMFFKKILTKKNADQKNVVIINLEIENTYLSFDIFDLTAFCTFDIFSKVKKSKIFYFSSFFFDIFFLTLSNVTGGNEKKPFFKLLSLKFNPHPADTF